jgi:16S rRNA (cytidine1402-2'-O)-methyltransferase
MMASGLNGQSFAFNGYLPVKPAERGKALKGFERRAHVEHQSQIFIEAPYRNIKLMEQMLQVCAADTLLTVACDITSHEEFIRTLTIARWREAGVPDIAKRPTIFIIG